MSVTENNRSIFNQSRIMMLLIAILYFIVVYSCEDVIDIDLNSAEPALVIEATLMDNGFCKTNISYTSDYFSDEEPEKVEDATLVLTDDVGNQDTLLHINRGLYVGQQIVGTPNHNYQLSAFIDSITYIGVTTMHESPEIIRVKSIESEYFDSFLGDSTYELSITFMRGDSLSQHFLVNTAIYENGNILYGDYDFFKYDETANLQQTFTPQGEFVEVDDTLLIFMYAVDEDTYDYYSDLVESDSGAPGSTPYNPYSNFKPTVLGYFGAMNRDIYQTIVKAPKEPE